MGDAADTPTKKNKKEVKRKKKEKKKNKEKNFHLICFLYCFQCDRSLHCFEFDRRGHDLKFSSHNVLSQTSFLFLFPEVIVTGLKHSVSLRKCADLSHLEIVENICDDLKKLLSNMKNKAESV